MNDDTTDFDQTDEDILTYTVSDEALEAAAGTERKANLTWTQFPCAFQFPRGTGS